MKKLSWLLNTLIATMSAAAVGGAGHFIAQRIIHKPPNEIIQEESYQIVMPDSFELLSDRQLALSPWLVDSKDNYVDGRFKYDPEGDAADYITVDKNGVVSVIQPTNELLSITVHEWQKSDIKKTVTIKIIAELSEVHEIRDVQGTALSSEVVMEIGESYTFDVVTMPAVTSVQEYFTFESIDGAGTAKDVFDVTVSNNQITLTAVGFGAGEMTFSLKNVNRGLDYSLAVPFKIQFPDATFNEAVAEEAENELLSPEELGGIQRLVFDEDETQFSIAKYEYLTGLKTMVFTAKEMVSVTGATLRKDLVFRVPAEAPEDGQADEYGLALYSAYLNDAVWGEYATTTYPYLDDYKKSVVVYHNEDTYSYAGKVFNGVSIEEQAFKEYTYVDAQTAPDLKAVNAEVGAVEEYTFTGYDFAGWKDLLGLRFESEDLPLIQEGEHVFANWTAKQYNITLHGWYADASKNDTVTVSYHQDLPTLADAAKQSWTFEGWYLSDEYLETEKVQPGIMYDSLDDLTLYAKYTTTVLRDDCGLGLDLAPIENVVYGKPIGDALNLSNDQLYRIKTAKWMFEGWNESFDYAVDGEITTGKAYVREGNPADGFSHTAHAKLTRQITFDTLGMSNDTMQPLTIIKGLTAQKSMEIYGLTEEDLTITAKTEGWTFKGWTFVPFIDYTWDNYGFAFELDGTKLAFDITEEFHIDYEIAYPMYETDITFEYAPKGDQIFVQQVYFGTRISMPDTEDAKDLPNWTEFDGYDFVNWYYANQNVTAPNEEFIDESFANKVYEAKYRAKVYTIYFHGEGGSDVGYTRYTDVGYDIEDNVLNNDENSYNCPGRTISVVAVPDKVGKTGYWRWEEKDLNLGVGETTWTVPDGFYGDLAFKAVYVNNQYTITLNTYGVMETDTRSVTYDKEYVLPTPAETPTGYTFDYWKDASGNIYEPGQSMKYLIANDIELFAYYFINVTHQGFNRTNVVPYQYGRSVTVELPIDHKEVQGWTFAGWYSKDAEGNEINLTYDDEDKYLINEYTSVITKYYSRWTREVSLDVGEGFGLENDTIIVERNKSLEDLGIKLPTDEEISKETDAAEKWTLVSWRSALDANETITEKTVFNDRNKDLKALKATYQSKIAIEIEYKSKMFDTVTGNESITLGDSGWLAELDSWFSDELKRDEDNGYEHHGWSVNGKEYLLNGNGEYDEGVDIVGISFGDNTIKAVFRSYGYYIEFDANGGSPTPAEMWLQIDEMVTFPAEIERQGYIFDGWEINGEKYDAEETVEALTTANNERFVAKAVWMPIQYNVVFDVSGGEALPSDQANITATYDVEFIMPTTTCVGYILTGWLLKGGDGSQIAAGQPQSNKTTIDGDTITYIACWKAITYHVVYDLGDGSMDGSDQTYDATYNLDFTFASGATREWYHFVGWKVNGELYEAGETVQNLTAEHDKTFTATAVWELTEYELRYREFEGGKVVAKVVFTYESTSYIQPIAPIFDAAHLNGYEASWDFSKLPLYHFGHL